MKNDTFNQQVDKNTGMSREEAGPACLCLMNRKILEFLEARKSSVRRSHLIDHHSRPVRQLLVLVHFMEEGSTFKGLAQVFH